MKRSLRLSDDLTLPVEIAGRRTAIFGISGSGKSNTATVVVEQLLEAGEQVVLIDPKGEGWGLLSLTNGKPSNLPLIVFGEPNGHIQSLAETHGPKLADFVVESGQSVVLSLLGFESDQSERRFVAAFLRQLYRRKSQRGQPTRTLVVIEEAHLFVPEHATGAATELAGAVQRIARQGRSFGLGTLLVDQRPQDVSKKVISQVDTLICHQLSHNTDRAALKEWVSGYDRSGEGKAFLEAVATLEAGDAWVWSPSWLKVFQRTHVNLRKTFDSGATPDGSKAAKKVQRADVDLDQLKGQLDELVEKAKADDPKELRRQIAERDKRIKELEKIKPNSTPAADIAKLVADREQVWRDQITEMQATVEVLIGDFEGCIGPPERGRSAAKALSARMKMLLTIDTAKHLNKLATNLNRGLEINRRSLERNEREHHGREIAMPAERKPTYTGNGEALPKGERIILTAIVQHRPLGGVSREELSVLTGYKRASRDAYLYRLREKNYITDGNGGTIIDTENGEAALGSYEPLPTGGAALEWWLQSGKLPAGERECLQVVARLNGANVGVSRESISDETEYKRASRDAYLYRLRNRKLIVDAGRGQVMLSPHLRD